MAPPLRFAQTTALVARNLGLTTAELLQSFRPAVASDLEALVTLRKEVFDVEPSWDDRRYLAWRYGLGTGRKSYATYRVLEVGGRIIAGIGAEEFVLHAPAGDTRAGSAMDIICLGSFRNCGLGAWMNLALFEEYPVVLALGSNDSSSGLVKRLYSPLDARSEFQFPLDARDFVRRRVAIPVLGAMAALLANILLAVRSVWYEWWNADSTQSIRPIARLHEDVDAKLKQAAPNESIAISRHADYLNWRFAENPRAEYRTVGHFDNDRLRSFVIYSSHSPSSGPGFLHVADWWLDDPTDLAPFKSVIAALVRDARARRMRFVRALALGTALCAELEEAGFVRRSSSGMAAGYHCASGQLESGGRPTGQWSLSGLGDDID